MFDLISKTFTTISILGTIAFFPASAEPAAPRFEIASYRLGMTNAEASQIGLTACTTSNTRAIPGGDHLITCTGKSPDLPEMPHPQHNVAPQFDGPYLSFDPKTKRLVRIEFLAFNWADPDPRTMELLKHLNVAPCGDRWRFVGRNDAWTCAVQPNRVLSVSHTGGKSFLRKWYPSHLNVVAVIDKTEVVALYAQRARTESASREKARRVSAAHELEGGR